MRGYSILPDLNKCREFLTRINQGRLLAYIDARSPEEAAKLWEQVESLDFEALEELLATAGHTAEAPKIPTLAPVVVQPLSEAKAVEGQYFLKAGRLAAFTVAGGQGSRLGYEGPKGCFGVTPVQGRPLFEVFAHKIAAAQKRYGVVIPWMLMTSPQNDQQTKDFFAAHNHFGLKAEHVFFFTQGVMPAIDAATGDLLLETPTQLALSPDGHGGSIKGLLKSGGFDWLKKRGITTLSYFQVDNPLVEIIDEAFVGAHRAAGSEFSSKSVAKKVPGEKVGVFAVKDGVMTIVEYSDLTTAQTEQRNAQGALTFAEGNVAIHLLEVAFLEKIAQAASLPYHRAIKKVPFTTLEGKAVSPTAPNAIKLEQFIFDAIPLARASIVARTTVEEFAPVKNADGVDSPATSKAGQLKLWAGWFAKAGITIPVDAQGVPTVTFEIDPLYADNAAELAARLASEKNPAPTQGRVYGV